jgi:hypothetical protein
MQSTVKFNPFTQSEEKAEIPLGDDASLGDAEKQFVEDFIKELRKNPRLREIVIRNFGGAASGEEG